MSTLAALFLVVIYAAPAVSVTAWGVRQLGRVIADTVLRYRQGESAVVVAEGALDAVAGAVAIVVTAAVTAFFASFLLKCIN